MANPIDNLAAAFKQGAPSVELSAAFIAKAGAIPPSKFDETLRAAFRLGATQGLSLTYKAEDVGPVLEDAFTIVHAQLSFLGYDHAQSDVKLRFRQSSQGVEVVIETVLSAWSFPITFPAMADWPFDQLSYATPTFVFSTEKTAWAWRGGGTIEVEPGQNFAGTAPVPKVFEPTFALVDGLGSLPSSVTMAGPIEVDKVTLDGSSDGPPLPVPLDDPIYLFPDLDLTATLTDNPVKVFFLEARSGEIGLLVDSAKEIDADIEPGPAVPQTPSLYFATQVSVPGGPDLDLRSRIADGGRSFGFSLMVDPASPTRLTPAEALKLLEGAGGGSFFEGVPAPLQQFLSSVELSGVLLTGLLPPQPRLDSVGMVLGTVPGTRYVLFGDPTTGQDFAITGFEVDWAILAPLDSKAIRNQVTITTTFELWKSVFDGEFVASVDQNLRVDARFDGTVSLAKVLDAVTNKAVQLPSGVDVEFSDVVVAIDPSTRSYALACTVDATLELVKLNDRPLLAIEAMRFGIGAVTPAGTGATAYSGRIAGYMSIGALAANVDASYNGAAKPPLWKLSASLAQPLHLSEIINDFFRAYELPDFLPGSIDIDAFSVDAAIPVGQGTKASYEIGGHLTWSLPFAELALAAEIGLQYEADRAGQEFSGSVIGNVELESFGTEIQVGYRFGPAAQDALDLKRPLALYGERLELAAGDSKVLWVAWEGIRGEYDFKAKTFSLSLAGWSAGRVIQALVRTIDDPYFELESPWTFLNQVSLDGLKLIFDFNTKQLSAEYTLSKPIELGFLTINGLYFRRDGKQVKLAISGSTTIKSLEGPLFDPAQGKDVRDLPSVPGQGSEYFDLKLLMLGQRVGIVVDPSKFKTTEDVIKALEKVPSTAGNENPLNPTDGGSLEPYYDPQRGWLVAMHFTVLKDTFDCMVVFNDPDLYGLRLKFSGDKAKVLDGLVIDVLYKKVTDDVGVYAVLFVFPKSLRNLDLGGVTVTLPTIGVQIYTNGDFLFDLGFPYNLDFSRSFGLQAVIAGVPVLGAAGLYFGRLSVGAAAQLPQSTPDRKLVGSFSTATAFGFGLQLGVGRYFEKGPLKAGFSITVFGIVEGIIAPWHSPTGTDLVPAAGGGALQSDYYFRLEGTFGLIGKLYGSVDFVVVKANVSLNVTFAVRIVYEAYADIVMSASASVSISASIEINLGIFSITLSFSFAATVTADLTIPSPQHDPPWYAKPLPGPLRTAPALPASITPPRPRTVLRSDEPTTTLHLHPAPQYTVLSSDGETLAAEEGAFVFLIVTDAPTADGSGNRAGSSFEALCQAFFPWVIDALSNEGEGHVELGSVGLATVSREQLQHYVSVLAEHPISESDIETKFLRPTFKVILEPGTERKDDLKAGATLFPAFSGLTLTVPNRSGSGTVEIALRDYVKITSGYRDRLNRYFAEVAARVEQESGGQAAGPVAADDDPEPLAEFLFEDWFALVGRQLLQAGADAIGDFAYPLSDNDSIGSIISWANARGNAIGPLDVVAPNLSHQLQGGRTVRIAGATYTVQLGDSLETIAGRYTDPAEQKRWQLLPELFVIGNANIKGLVAAGIKVSYEGNSAETGAGESFTSLAEKLKVDLSKLAADKALHKRPDLLAPSTATTIPPLDYRTTSDDTFQAIIKRFDVPLAALAEDAHNLQEPLFAANAGGQGFRLARLESLPVSEVWEAIQRTDEVAQVAGMVARFQLHGMRLPAEAGLLLPDDFVYPAGLTEYGLYQLSGQQFPTPDLTSTPNYSISLSKDDSLSWLELPTSSFDLSQQARQLHYLLEYARDQAFAPSGLSIAAEPAVMLRPKRYAVQSSTPWATSDETRLLDITTSSLAATDGPQISPILWNLPDSLLSGVAQRQEALAKSGLKTKEALPYLSVVQPQVGTTDPATGRSSFDPLEHYALATRVQVEVKRLAQTDDLAPQRPHANDVIPPGPGNSGAPTTLAPFNYELVGVGPADAVLLERLLVAMSSLGEDMISQLFLLYQTTEPGAPGLTSRSDAEFVSFITQTNLSTDTNPPSRLPLAEDGRQPRGIANSPAEFVKLLWELSTVRSGGYYLYYELLREKAGLPDALFDSSGAATLTLVIAYDRDRSPADALRLLDCANAFVTTDPVDVARSVMTLESQSSPATSQPLRGVETLAELSDLYGTDVGELAGLNSTVAFATEVEIPISGIVHQVDLADMSSGNVLGNVAAIYSRGAKTPISVAELAAFNPGVTPTLGAILRIPPFTYVANPLAGPGNSFGSLHAYYGMSYDALGYAARLVPGLYPTGSSPAVDSRQRDTQTGTGTGNAGVELRRDPLRSPCPNDQQPCPPLNPTPEQIAAFGSASLDSLYTLLSAGVQQNAFFSQSPQAVPAGPRKSHAPEEAGVLRDPAARRALLDAAGSDPLDYVQTIGFGSFSTVNPAPAGDPDGPLPSQRNNPYAGVGTTIQMHLRWLDLFGNLIVSAFDVPPSGYQGPLNNLPEFVGYSDRIIGLGQWPNVRADYLYDGSPGTPELNIAFRLETATYDAAQPGWREAATNDLKTFIRIYFQLNQNYDTVNVPGISGQAISMSLTNTLLDTPEVQLSDGDARGVRDFVAACLSYVWHRSRGEDGGQPPTATIAMPVPPGDVVADDVIPVSLSFTLTRQAALADPALRVAPGGLADRTEVLPRTNESNDPNVSLHDFAAKAEAVFETADWQLRIGTSAAAPGASGTDGLGLWAVRMAKTPGSGLGYAIQPGASFYATEPLATALRDFPANIGVYQTGQKFPAASDALTFAGVDPNAWAQQAFSAVDAFLSATYAAPAFVVDQLLFSDPENEGYLAKILEHKKTLAGAVSSTVKPILVTSAVDKDSVDAAKDKLYQALLKQLSAASTITAITVYKVSGTKVRRPLPPGVAPPRFYGQPLGKPPVGGGGGLKDNFALSSAKIPLDASTGDGESRLAFLFSSKNVTEHAYVPLELSFAMSHLEHDIVAVPGIDDYQQSQWIKFVTGPFSTPLLPPPRYEQGPSAENSPAVELPVVLRALPQPPSVTAQAAVPTHPQGVDPDELARWDYSFSYLYRAAAQDAVSAKIEFNRGPSIAADPFDATEQELFEKLAQFVSVQPAIAHDLEAYLRPIDGNSVATDPGVQDAKFALAALETIMGELANAYDAWSKRSPMSSGNGPEHLTYEFDVVLVDKDGRARIEISSDDADLPKPFVHIDADYEAVDMTPGPPPVRWAFEYKRKGSADDWLPYHDALGSPTRVVGYADLDVFARQDGYASIHVSRNIYLLPPAQKIETTKTFQFSTPQVRFADRIVPLLAYREFDLERVTPPPAPLETYLNTFFADLLAGADGQQVAVKMNSSYSFQLVPGMDELPRTVLPINLLPPTPMTKDSRAAIASLVAGKVDDWLRGHARPDDGAPRITFGLEVFAAAASEEKPILTIGDLYIAVEKLAQPA